MRCFVSANQHLAHVDLPKYEETTHPQAGLDRRSPANIAEGVKWTPARQAAMLFFSLRDLVLENDVVVCATNYNATKWGNCD